MTPRRREQCLCESEGETLGLKDGQHPFGEAAGRSASCHRLRAQSHSLDKVVTALVQQQPGRDVHLQLAQPSLHERAPQQRLDDSENPGEDKQPDYRRREDLVQRQSRTDCQQMFPMRSFSSLEAIGR